ncbi:MAG: hypothetical protein KGH60_02900 [Candidatus Micrarchaeota archaeon]|nr:hypothetical protein [Candidatus Micrarchaeota archaeon]
MNWHVFVVDTYSYPVHTTKGFCGVKNPKGGGRKGLLYDIKTYRKGDYVIFYQMRVDESSPLSRGFRDVFRIVSDPFYDDTSVTSDTNTVLGKCPICGYSYSEKPDNDGIYHCTNPNVNPHTIPTGQHILPYRVLIEPVMRFDDPVDDNTAYIDVEDNGELPTLRWRKITGAGRSRSAQRILPEEAEKLVRLMKKINANYQNDSLKTLNYTTPQMIANKLVPETLNIVRDTSGVPLYTVKRNGSLADESGLEAWMLENIDKNIPVLAEIIGDLDELEFWGNNVQDGVGGENADILTLHKRNGKRFKATVFELKKDEVNKDTINQVLNPEKQNYAKWIGQLVTANCNPPIEKLQIQPIMVGFKVDQSAIEQIQNIQNNFSTFTNEMIIDYKYRNRTSVKIKVLKPILLSYKVVGSTVELRRESYTL